MNGQSGAPLTASAMDLVIQHLALDSAELVDQRASDLADLETYRTFLQVAVTRVHEQTLTILRQTALIEALRDELRRYTSAVVRGRAA